MPISKVLVVDDSSVDLAHIKTIVSDQGYFVTTATSGAEALIKAKSEKPDLIFMDVIMNDLDGFKACRKLQGDPTTKNIPVIFLTSKNQKADKAWAEMQGGKGYITKPAEADKIADEIRRFS